MFIFEDNDPSEYLDVEIEDLSVTNILSKYKITTEAHLLYNVQDDYKALLDYISELYVENQEVPKDIIDELYNNLNLKSYLYTNINDRMHKILSDNTTIVFKEIVTIVNLLSFGKNFEIFESYNFYNIDNMGKLFREFEKSLQELKEKNEEDFLITFSLYTILIEAVNELCTINSTDVLRKKTINPIIQTLSETINMVKYSVKLNEEQINTLNNILGKLLFYYSHIPYIDTKDKDAKYLIDEFKFNLEKLNDGYQLSKNTNFGGDEEHEKYYVIFLNSVTTLLSTLIYKLEVTYNVEEYNSIEMYHQLLELYSEVIEHIEIPEFDSIKEFKKQLLTNYIYIYNKDLDTNNYLYMIDKFLESEDFNSSNMHIIHSSILFSSKIPDESLIKILEILISFNKYTNDYHEFYKLNVCDVIINKFIQKKKFFISDDLVKNIVEYIEENKIASHLMSIYSKLYLSLSEYYSHSNSLINIEKSKLYYFNYLSINGEELLMKEYSKINNSILLNHGKKAVDELDIEGISLNNEKYIQLGTKLFDNYFEQQEINMKYNINQKLSNIVTEIFTDEGLNDDKLNTYIENFISKDIFYGLAFSSVEGLCQHGCRLIDIGYEKIEIPLIDGYKLRMAYSNVYRHIFDNIYTNNKEYIKQNIINLIVSYIKSIPIYNDTITNLSNKQKLKYDLINMKDDEELIIVELYVETLLKLNRLYGYDKTNVLFREFAQNINSLVTSYRLNGPKIGFVLKEGTDFKSIIEKIKTFDLIYNDEIFEPELIVAVAWGDKTNILEKGSHSMSLALTKSEKYYEFK